MADPIKFTDLIKPDDTINELIQQLRDAKDAYEKLSKTVKEQSNDMAKSLNTTSGATEEGKQKILELAAAADRLAAAEKAVSAAIDGIQKSEKGLTQAQKEVASASASAADNMEELRKELEKAKQEAAENTKRLQEQAKAQKEVTETTQQNAKAQKQEAEEIEHAADSYRALKKELKDLDKLFKTLSESERLDPELGGDLAAEIISLKKALKDIDAMLTPHVSKMSELEKAQKAYAFASSDAGKQVAWLKAQTAAINKEYITSQAALQHAIGSYDSLRATLKQLSAEYKAMSASDRQGPGGQAILASILETKTAMSQLEAQMKPYTQALTQLEKAKQKLAYLQTNEGRQLMEIRAQINAIVTEYSKQEQILTDIEKAKRKLAFASSEENRELKLYTSQIREANRVAELEVAIANSAEGSYNRLSAQYALNKIRLNQMGEADEGAVRAKRALELETKALYQQMIKLQEATGNHTLSVGNYKKVWNGLGMSVNQIVRELPAAAISLNTFFLGISNNVPILMDEIKKVRDLNAKLIAEGKQTKSVIGEVTRALFSWNTAMVLILTAFAMHGETIINWITNLFRGEARVLSLTERLKSLNEELENTNNNYGNNTVKLKQLQQEWKNLKTTTEKDQWIKDNKSNFDQLGISVNNITEAENAFVYNTEAVINALKLRAKAAAAQKLAADGYEKALIARNKAETEQKRIDEEGISVGDRFRAKLYGPVKSVPGAMGTPGAVVTDVEQSVKNIIKALEDEAEAAEKTSDAYFDLAAGYEEAANAQLKAASIKGKHKTTKEPRDLTRTINQNDIKIQRKYEESVTELLKDEYAKRRKAAADEVQDENNKLREMYRLNEEYVKNVDGKYKKLTEGQKKQIGRQQELISKTIANNLKALDIQLQQIQNEQKVASLQTLRNTINPINTRAAAEAAKKQEPTVTTEVVVARDTSQMEASLVEERKLMEKNLNLEYALILDTNKRLLKAGDSQARSEEEILVELNKKKLELWSEYDQKILDARERDIENQLELVKKGSEDELKLLLQQNEVRRQLALAQNAAKPAEQQASTSVINAQFDKSAVQIKGSFQMTSFDEQQRIQKQQFDSAKHNQQQINRFTLQQEKERWDLLIALAEAGALDWKKPQIDAAKEIVNNLKQQISDNESFIARVGERGFKGALFESFGWDEDQIDAMSQATNFIVNQFSEILAAEVALAEKEKELADERVARAQSAYEAEVEARNNGYANNVATAKKELEQEKKNQQEKQKILANAQKRQEALNTITQASSLVTASANLWSSFSSIPIVGPALAIAAIASMWTSFAVAKVKAKQVTASSEEYGEGGLEFLEGGSHASGDDIDLGTSNKKGKRMRAEGGEALAIINKHKTRKYRKILPDVIESFNKGTFEDKYLKAFDGSDGLSISLNANGGMDLSKLEDDVRSIRKQNETRYYTMPDGTIIMQHRNVKRIIKN